MLGQGIYSPPGIEPLTDPNAFPLDRLMKEDAAAKENDQRHSFPNRR